MAGSESKAAKDLTAMDFSLMPELDEMGTRIDDLEKNVADLMTQAGMEDHHKSKQ
ncbi:hypothetical protein ABG768_011441 [Culter alburnus]|uniref:Heat shock factor binding protein 1 n=1 Tax=Culter alburnus TaxID=194366 RepID=A0AAW1Z9T7_CULAL